MLLSSFSFAQSIARLDLINADNNTVIQALVNNATLDINSIGTDNFSVDAIVGAGTGSVRFEMTGPINHIKNESYAPYALFGDNSGVFGGQSFTPGNYTLTVIPYPQTGQNGTPGPSDVVHFTVVNNNGTPATTVRYEAENVVQNPANILADVGTKGTVQSQGGYCANSTILNISGSAVSMYDAGDKLRFPIQITKAGATYSIRARGRSLGSAENAGYELELDGVAVPTIIRNVESQTGEDSNCYGTASFIEVQFIAYDLALGNHTIDVEAGRNWLALDYVEVTELSSSIILPRFEAENFSYFNVNNAPSELSYSGNALISGSGMMSLKASGDELTLYFWVPSTQNYDLRLHHRSGSGTDSLSYTNMNLSLDGVSRTDFLIDNATLQGPASILGSSHWAEKVLSSVLLTEGVHSLTVEATQAYQSIDYLDVIPSTSGVICSDISTLDCPSLAVSVPYAITFDGNEGGLLDNTGIETGFLMVDAPSNRVAEDGAISYPDIPGYEPSRLQINGGKLIIDAAKGLRVTGSNSELNTLGVPLNTSEDHFYIETTIDQPLVGSGGNYEQAGLWIGLDEANFIKLAVGHNQARIELNKEVNNIYDTSSDYNGLTSDLGRSNLSSQKVQLRLEINRNAQTVTGYYALGGGDWVQVHSFSLPSNYFTARTLSDGLSPYQCFAGIYASRRNLSSAISFAFDNFKIEPVNQASGELYAIADGNWTSAAVWSYSEGGSPANIVPDASHTVIIKGYTLQVSTQVNCAQIIIYDDDTGADRSSKVLIQSTGILQVENQAEVKHLSGGNYQGKIEIAPSGKIFVGE